MIRSLTSGIAVSLAMLATQVRASADTMEEAAKLLREGRPAEADERLLALTSDTSVPLSKRLAAMRLRVKCRRRLADFGAVADLSAAMEAACEAAGDVRGAALARSDRAAAGLELGRASESRALLLGALEVLDRVGATVDGVRPRLALAQAEAALGRYAEALRVVETADRSASTDADLALRVRLVYSASLLRTGDVARAEEVLRGLLAQPTTRSPASSAEIHGNLAQVLAEGGDNEGALAELEISRSAYDATSDVRGRFVAETTASQILRKMRRTEDALAHAKRASALAVGSPMLERYAEFETGASLAAEGRWGEARAVLEEVLASSVGAADLDLVVAASIELAEGFANDGNLRAASEHARRALAQISTATAGLSDDRSAIARAHRGRLFAVAVRASRMSHDTAACLDAIERCRAVGLLCSLGGGAAARATDQSAALRAAVADRRRAADDARAAFDAAVADPELRLARIREAKKAAEAARVALDDAAERLQREERIHASVAPPAPATTGTVMALLAPGQAFVSICTLTTDAFALVVERGATEPRVVELGAAADVVLRLAGRPLETDDVESAVAHVTKEGRWLLDRLALAPATTSVVLSVDANLAGVPFPALLGAAPERVAAAMVPSATVWASLAAYPRVVDRPVLAIAVGTYAFEVDGLTRRIFLQGRALGDLPNAVEEGRRAAGKDGRVLADAEATETAARAAMQEGAGWDAIHVVSHGFLDSRLPALAGLALRADATDDGFLHVREVLDLRVRTNLVVLAACESGLGRVIPGEGVWGLGRAFMLAGAPRVLVSLWKVDDAATTTLMAAFHDARRAGASTAAALEAAQARVRHEKPEWRHPRFWAAWQLWGLPG